MRGTMLLPHLAFRAPTNLSKYKVNKNRRPTVGFRKGDLIGVV
jgi:hypothetical protein